MEILNTERTKLNNTIELIGEPSENNILIVGVVHGDEPQGKYLIEEYLKTHYNFPSNSDLPPSSKSKISVLPPREDKRLTQLARTLRNNMTVQEIKASTKLLFSEKASLLIVVTLAGTVIVLNPVFENAFSPINQIFKYILTKSNNYLQVRNPIQRIVGASPIFYRASTVHRPPIPCDGWSIVV